MEEGQVHSDRVGSVEDWRSWEPSLFSVVSQGSRAILIHLSGLLERLRVWEERIQGGEGEAIALETQPYVRKNVKDDL